jgi:type I site-specific restriction endonuclease
MTRLSLLATAALLAGTAFARAQGYDDDSRKFLMFGLGEGYGYGKAEAETQESVREAEDMERLRQETRQDQQNALREAKEYADRAAASGNHPVINRPTVVDRPVVRPIPTQTPTVVNYQTLNQDVQPLPDDLKATSEEIQRNRAKDIAEEQKRQQALAQAVREAHQARGYFEGTTTYISAIPTPK